MTAIRKLQKSALELCIDKGHDMKEFELWVKKILPNGKFHIVEASLCKNCGRSVWIDNSPRTNEIEICGEAVIANCGEPR